MPNRILVYTHGLVGGGAERVLATLASGLAHRGHAVHFAVDFEANESRHLLANTIPLSVLGNSHLAGTFALAKLLRAEHFDVALSAVGGSNVKLIAALMLARSPTRAIIGYHGFEEYRSGRLGALSYRLLPILSRKAARTVAVSEALKDDLIQKWGAKAQTAVRIYNPVVLPADRFCAASQRSLACRPPVVVAVGRLVPDKDFITLLKAFSQTRTPNAQLVIVGEGPERRRLEDEIRSLDLAGRATLAGHQTDPGKFYSEARCFVSSSRTESFGNAIVEALYCGLPVVATDCAGPHEILGGGQWGRLVPIGDAQALARAIDAALDEPDDPNPRRLRAATFSDEAGIRAYEALIEQVMLGGRAV